MKIRNQVTFAIVPEWLLYSSVSAQAVRLYGVLNRHADKSGRARPSRRRMADLVQVSRKTIDRSLDELESIGAVTIKPNYSQRGDQTANDYVVNVVPKGATQMSMGGDIDVATPLDIDVAQNESHSEREKPPVVLPAGGRGDGSKPSRTEVRGVACPNCGASAGEKCWGRDGGYRRESNHRERVDLYLGHSLKAEEARAAARARREKCEECDGMGIVYLEDEEAGMPCPSCRSEEAAS